MPIELFYEPSDEPRAARVDLKTNGESNKAFLSVKNLDTENPKTL